MDQIIQAILWFIRKRAIEVKKDSIVSSQSRFRKNMETNRKVVKIKESDPEITVEVENWEKLLNPENPCKAVPIDQASCVKIGEKATPEILRSYDCFIVENFFTPEGFYLAIFSRSWKLSYLIRVRSNIGGCWGLWFRKDELSEILSWQFKITGKGFFLQ